MGGCVTGLLVEQYHWARPAAEAVDDLIANRESGCDPRAFNPTSCNGECRGLVQWDRKRWHSHLARCRLNGLDPYSREAQVATLVAEWLQIWPHAAARIQREDKRHAKATFSYHFLAGHADR